MMELLLKVLAVLSSGKCAQCLFVLFLLSFTLDKLVN